MLQPTFELGRSSNTNRYHSGEILTTINEYLVDTQSELVFAYLGMTTRIKI
jgi:hypothetical protein